MKLYTKVLALAYIVAVSILLFLEFSQFKEVDHLRGQISQSYEVISGRDEGIRLELEYRRFSSIAAKYVLGSKINNEKQQTNVLGNVSHDTVLKWFDILWSRVFGINTAGVEVPYKEQMRFEKLLADLRSEMRSIDPVVQHLVPGDIAGLRTIERALSKYEGTISDMASLIAQTRLQKAGVLQRQLEAALLSMDSLLLTSAAGVALILSLFGVEAYRARKEEKKIKGREARIRFLAEHDPLTGLGNRAFLNEKMNEFINHADETGTGFNLILFDLDKFKDVNDTFGHPMGDRLLKNAAARLTSLLSAETDIVTRLGGDEFAVLQRTNLASSAQTVQKAIEALSSAFELSGNDICISSSVGISRYPTLSSSADELLRNADLALYEAKSTGRQTYCIYEPRMSVAIQNRMRLEADLRSALQYGGEGLEVYYQPQVSTDTSSDVCKIAGVEALVRWFHPEQGQIPTMDFIEIAEDAGLIGTLSDWIFKQAFTDLVSWHRAGFKLHLSINLSPHQLNNDNLPAELLDLIDQTGFDPTYLTLEITESVDVKDTRNAAKLLSQLSAKGIALAMDDFGTGYSNLGYLKSLPLDILKIDRSFVQQIEDKNEDRKLVRGVINLAQGMGLSIIAEGVETEQQMLFLRENNCNMFQGFLFGRPMHKLALLAMLNEARSDARPGLVEVHKHRPSDGNPPNLKLVQ
nr:EAL domain-containing protein [uncultured Cohaesibacter sp.]